MKIVLTGSLGNIGRPLATALTGKGHEVTVISSHPGRGKEIETLGAKAVIGSMHDARFLKDTFTGADVVYLMETIEAVGDIFDKSIDFIGAIEQIGRNYKYAIEHSGVKKVIHLSSIGAHMETGNGILLFHHRVETLLRQLPDDVAIKFIRPVGFYINLFNFIPVIKKWGNIISNYGGDTKEPWVSPVDIAAAIVEEIEKPFAGKIVRYVASDEASPDEVAKSLGQAIGKPDLRWIVIPDEQLLDNWLQIGMNEQVARGFVEVQRNQGNGLMYEDYNQHKPLLGKVKLEEFAKEFAIVYEKEGK